MTQAIDGPAATTVYDHPFEPRGEWWTVCRHCGLAEASHIASALRGGEPPVPPQRPTARGPERDPDDEPMPLPVAEVDLSVAQEHMVRPSAPEWSGGICSDCGGMMQRTGSCETCPDCGGTTGCG